MWRVRYTVAVSVVAVGEGCPLITSPPSEWCAIVPAFVSVPHSRSPSPTTESSHKHFLARSGPRVLMSVVSLSPQPAAQDLALKALQNVLAMQAPGARSAAPYIGEHTWRVSVCVSYGFVCVCLTLCVFCVLWVCMRVCSAYVCFAVSATLPTTFPNCTSLTSV